MPGEEHEDMGEATATVDDRDGDSAELAASAGRRRALDDDILAALDGRDHRRALLLCAQHHGPALGRFCMSMLGSQADAEDVTQETLLDAHAGFDGWRREGSLRAWLMTIARRKCARLLERRARRTARLRLVHDADDGPGSDAAPDRQVLLQQRAERAREAVSTLRPSEREALLLRYGAALSYEEVSLACGCDEAAARKRVSRAISHLRRTLRDSARRDTPRDSAPRGGDES